jgi:hypothetical protein
MWGTVASEPEAFGLEIVAEVEYSDGCYQFDTRIVWRDKETGRLYTARGCSCPIPFESYDRRNIEIVDFGVLKAEINK